MKNKKIDFQAGAENLRNDVEYQQALVKFNAENFSPEQIAKYKKRKQIAIAMIVLGVFIFFINPSVSLMLIFLSLIFFVKPKFDELAFQKEKFAKENGLAILPDDYSNTQDPVGVFDYMAEKFGVADRFLAAIFIKDVSLVTVAVLYYGVYYCCYSVLLFITVQKINSLVLFLVELC